MAKRKAKSHQPISSDAKKKKIAKHDEEKPQIEAFTSIEFCKMLQDPVLFVKGLRKFCQAARRFQGSVSPLDIVKSYIAASPECSEIFKLIEKGKTSPMNVCLVFETFVVILQRTSTDLSQSYGSVGISITRRILQGHLREVYGALSLRNPARVVVPTLRMLTAMVLQGSDCASDVAGGLDLGGKLLISLAKYQSDKKQGRQTASTNVRMCFVRFVLSFFGNGSLQTIRRVLEARGFVDSIFRGLPSDPASVIKLFLSTLLEKVFKNPIIPKTNKIKLLAAHEVLISVSELFEWDGPMDIVLEEEEHSGKQFIHNLAYEFLFRSCCSHKYGINFRDREFGTASRSRNHVLLKFLIDLKTAASNALAHSLVVEILCACPDLLGGYLTAITLSFDPRATQRWMENTQLLMDIYSSQPAVPPALTETARSFNNVKHDAKKLTAMCVHALLPACFKAPTVKLTLKHSSTEVQLRGLQLLINSIRNLDLAMDFIKTDSNWLESVYSAEERSAIRKALIEEIAKCLPELNFIFTTWTSGARKEDDELVPKVQEKLLATLFLYQKLFPTSFASCNHDFSLLLHGIDNSALPPSDETVLSAVGILAHSPHKYKWFKKVDGKPSSFHQLIKLILTLLKSDRSCDVINKTVQLATKVCVTNDVISPVCSNELIAWLSNMNSDNDDDASELLTGFVSQCAAEVAMRPHRFANNLTSVLESLESGTAIDKTALSSVDEDWWSSIPDVEIPRASDRSLKVNDETDQTNVFSHNRSAFSLLLIAAWRELSQMKATEQSTAAHQSIERYLVEVMVDLFYDQTYREDSDRFTEVLQLIFKETQSTGDFPAISSVLEKLATWNPSSAISHEEVALHDKNYPEKLGNWFSQASDVARAVFFSEKLTTKKRRERLEALMERAIPVEDMFASHREALSTKSELTVFQEHNLAIALAQFLYHSAQVLNTCPQKLEKRLSSQIAHLLKYLCQAPFVLFSDIMRSVENASEKPGDEVKSSYSELYVRFSEKLLGISVFQDLYLSREKFRVSIQVGLPISKVIRNCHERLAASRLSPCFTHYVNKLCDTLCTSVLTKECDGPEFSDHEALVWECFECLSDVLDNGQLQKVTSTAIRFLSEENQHLQIALKYVNRSVDLLLSRTSRTQDGVCFLSAETLKAFLTTLSSIEMKTETRSLFVKIAFKLSQTYPSVSLLVDGDVLCWCYKHRNVDDVWDMMQLYLSQNAKLHDKYLTLLCDETGKGDDPRFTSMLAIPTKFPQMLQRSKYFNPISYERFLSKRFVNDVMSSLWLHPHALTSQHVDIVEWLLKSSDLHTDLLQQLVDHLPQSFDCETRFKERWKIAELAMDCIKTSEELASFRCRLVLTLMKLSSGIAKGRRSDDVTLHDDVTDALMLLAGKLSNDAFMKADDLVDVWNSYVRRALKCQFSNPKVLDCIGKFLLLLYQSDACADLLSCTMLLQMITSHSCFFDTILSGSGDESSEAKLPLVRLIQLLVARCTDGLQAKDYSYLLASYQATLSQTDQCILQILLLYESKGISSEDWRPFLWGNTALESHRAMKNMVETLYKKSSPNKILSCFDSDVMSRTLENFPIRRRMLSLNYVKECTNPTFHILTESRVYDPCFLLPVLSDLLDPANLVDCRSFARQGALSFLLQCLASHCPAVRCSAANSLAKFYDHAEALRFSEKNLTLHLLYCARNAVTIERGFVKKLSAIAAVYLSKMAELAFQPQEHIYTSLHRFLLVKPDLDLRIVPEFYVLFFSAAMEYKIERRWILDLLALGMRDMGDYHTMQRRQLLRILMSYYGSPTSDNHSRRQVLKVIERSVAIRPAAFDLLNEQGLLPWLLHVIIQQRDPSLSRDGGSDRSKRENAAVHVSRVLTALWASLEPNSLLTVDAEPIGDPDQHPGGLSGSRGDADGEGDEQKNLTDLDEDNSMEERVSDRMEVETSGASNYAASSHDGNKEVGDGETTDVQTAMAPKELSKVSSLVIRQLVPICFDVLQELIRMSELGESGAETSDTESTLWSVMYDVIGVLKRSCRYQSFMDFKRQSEGGSAVKTVRIMTSQARTLLLAAKELERNVDDKTSADVVDVLLHWTPSDGGQVWSEQDALQVFDVMCWLCNHQMATAGSTATLERCLRWMLNWIAFTGFSDLPEACAKTLKKLILRLHEFACANVRPDRFSECEALLCDITNRMTATSCVEHQTDDGSFSPERSVTLRTKLFEELHCGQ